MVRKKTLLFWLVFSGVISLADTGVWAQDKITKTDDNVLTGQITGVLNNQIQIKLPVGTVGVPIFQVKSVEMKAPPEVAASVNASPAQIIATLGPIANTFKGLPADWAVEAMATVADAYSAQGDGAKAQELYVEMGKLYPGSRYLIKANVGLAKTALQNKQPDEALKLVEPLIVQSSQKFFYPEAECRLYSEAFFVQGQAFEAKGKFPEALASYLMTSTVFYQNEKINAEAVTRVAKLREANPKLSTP
jgi:hypothetical protein